MYEMDAECNPLGVPFGDPADTSGQTGTAAINVRATDPIGSSLVATG